MNYITRYDNKIKAELSKYSNNALDKLLVTKGCSNKIVIGEQDLECENDLRTLRYGYSHYQNYDGIHLKGKLAVQHMTMTYVNMLTNIFPHLKEPAKQVQRQLDSFYHLTGYFSPVQFPDKADEGVPG